MKQLTSYIYTVVFLFLSFLPFTGTRAQPVPATAPRFGNEWITYGQPYYKLAVTKNGIYRVTQAYLQSRGIVVQNPNDLRLYRRGRELPLYVASTGSGFDYLEFYGKRNDALLDSALFLDPALQIQPYFSLYTDTSSYFLTLAPGSSMRMQALTSAPQPGQTTLTYHVQQRIWYNTYVPFTNPKPDTAYDSLPRPFSYQPGRTYSTGSDARLPWADAHEGYTSRILEGTSQKTDGSYDSIGNRNNMLIDSLFNMVTGSDTLTAPRPFLRIRINGSLSLGVTNNEHIVQVLVGRSLATVHPVDTVRLQMWETVEVDIPFNFRDIDPVTGKLVLRIRTRNHSPTTPAGYGDRISISYANVHFPQYFDLAGKSRSIYPPGNGPYVLNLTNAPANAVLYDFTDSANVKRITPVSPVVPGTPTQFIVPANQLSSASPHYFIASSTAFYEPEGFRQVTFQQPNQSADYLIISHQLLTKPTQTWPVSVSNPVQEYANYRAANGFIPSIVLVDDLYDQFHYGEKSSVAIRHYIDYMRAANPASDPKFVFIIGKGIMVGGGAACDGTRFNDPCQETDLIPPFGRPGSDLPYVTDWKNGNYVPVIPIGRIAATSSDQVMAYLDKVQVHESLPDTAIWRKHILHLGGGKFETERLQYLGYLNSYKAIAEGACFGGFVTTKTRQNLNLPVETINVTDEVNKGISLLTFFGHSAPNASDIEIGYASNPVNGYNNEGKYPFILMNGCASGDLYQGNDNSSADSFGEDWILTRKKGAIGFLGHTGVGYAILQDDYSKEFYESAFRDSATYGKPVGVIQKKIISDLQTAAGTGLNNDGKYKAMLTEMVLQGDPYVSLFSPEKPDLTFNRTVPLRLEASGVGGITATAPSFKLVMDVRNLGKACAESDSVTVRISRSFSGSQPILLDTVINLIRYRETISVTIPRQFGSEGINVFEVTLDFPNAISELNEQNNVATLSYFLPISSITTLMPGKYSIVSDPAITFVGQATDVLANGKKYLIEVDTSYLFTSPLLVSPPLTGVQALVTWQTTLPTANLPNDTTAFFWRIRFVDTVAWVNSSFTYIQNSPPGWAQVDFGQLIDTRKEGIKLTEPKRKWEFEPRTLPVEIRAVGNGVPYNNPPFGIFLAAFTPFNGNGCTFGTSTNNRGFNVAILDQYTLNPIADTNFTAVAAPYRCDQYLKYYRFKFMGRYNKQSAAQNVKDSIADINQMLSLDSLIKAAPNGSYVILMSANDVRYDTLRLMVPQLATTFQTELNSNFLQTLQPGNPWALIAQKNSTTGFVTKEITAPVSSPQDTLYLRDTLTSTARVATITSPTIGPAQSWDNLVHIVKRPFDNPADNYKLEVIGYDLNGNSQVVVPNVTSSPLNLTAAGVTATAWPYLQLKMTVSDTVFQTPPQLDKWLVTHADVPEGIVRAIDSNIPNKNQGEIFPVTFSFKNISNQAFADSILVQITITDGTTTNVTTEYLPALSPGDSATLTFQVNTANLRGPSFVRVYVNPKIQVEKYYFNNILELPFNVIFDNQHPLLEVAFDGVHIMDGDIVSPSPEIMISLKDENQSRFKQDTAGMVVQLTSPNGTTENIYLTNPNSTTPNNHLKYGISWTPAGPGQNFIIRFKPEGLPDGIYTLTVQGADASGNKAGLTPYKITFEVINESTLSNFYPYPNPFSTSCRFVFTLTGSRIPEQMKIQVLSLTGKVVKEITREELGHLRIGVNGNRATDYHWDGKDEYGDQLANGVYLYRVVIGNKGSDFEARKLKADQSFTKEYGKLYILR